MKRLLLALLLVSTPVWGCESYEECIETGDNYAGHRSGPIASLEEVKSAEYLKAIAYKLDEISKKLDKQENWVMMDEDGRLNVYKKPPAS